MGEAGPRKAGRPWGALKGDDLALHGFARHLRGLVDGSGLTLTDLAARCACSSTTVSKRLNGAELPPWEFVAKLNEACTPHRGQREHRKSKLRGLWEQARDSRGRILPARRQGDRALDVRTEVIIAQSVAIDAQRQVIEVHDELQRAQRQLVDSHRAERRSAEMVWVLYWALNHAFQLIGQLTQERDEVGARGGELDRVQGRLAEAQDSHARTEHQLERAQHEQQRAIALVAAAGRKIITLQRRLLALDPTHSPRLELGDEPSTQISVSEDSLQDMSAGLDRMDRLLDDQSVELTRLSAAIIGPVSSEDDDPDETQIVELVGRLLTALGPRTLAARLHGMAIYRSEEVDVDARRAVLMNPDAGLRARVRAADDLSRAGLEYYGTVAKGLRLILQDDLYANIDKMPVLHALGKLGDSYMDEAVAILRAIMHNGDQWGSVHLAATNNLARLDRKYAAEAVAYLKNIIIDPATTSQIRVYAAEAWARMAPENREQAVAVIRPVAADMDESALVRTEAVKALRDINVS